MNSTWRLVDRDQERKIVFLEDTFYKNGKTITNDAEWVYDQVATVYYPRVVYQDTDKEWWEIIQIAGDRPGEWRIAFKPWHGEVWDVLS